MISALAPLWLSDPAWCAMDATARGFHTQLVLLAARQDGELPDDEALWRQWLGIAPAQATSTGFTAAMVLAGLDLPDLSRTELLGAQQHLMERLWEERWGPMVRQAWRPCGRGRLTCDAAQALASTAAVPAPGPTALATPAPAPASPAPKKRTKRKASVNTSLLPLEQLLHRQGLVGQGLRSARPLSDQLLDREKALALWHLPATRSQRLNVWSVGLEVLTTGPGENASNRSYLASLIRQYGERKVASAVGEISGRSTRPADPRSFLRSILRRETEGSVGAQQARERRASVPL